MAAASFGTAAALAAAVVFSWPFARGQGILLAVAAVGLACLLGGLSAAWVEGLPWGVVLLAAGFLVRLQLDPAGVGPWTPVVAGALLLTAELGSWSQELDGTSVVGGAGVPVRALELALLTLAAVALCQLVTDLADLAPVSGAWLLVAGVLAATAPAAILLRLARR